jgi:hypothetical protein
MRARAVTDSAVRRGRRPAGDRVDRAHVGASCCARERGSLGWWTGEDFAVLYTYVSLAKIHELRRARFRLVEP